MNPFRTLVDSFADVEELHLQGLGDPLMHPDFFRMVEYARARGTQSDHWSRND